MVAADVPAPDMIGDDILKDGRVVGMMEFGWSSEKVAVAEEEIPNTDYRIIHFEPGQTSVGETISKMLKELGVPNHERQQRKTSVLRHRMHEILRKLPDRVTAKFMDMMTRYMSDPSASGLNLETVEGARDNSIKSLRVDQGYRAIAFEVGRDIMFVHVE